MNENRCSNVGLNDLKILKRATKLSIDKLITLIEEERDLDLVLQQVVKNLQQRQIEKFTPLIKLKCVILKFSEHLTFDIDEKSYVAKSVFNHLPKISEQRSNRIAKVKIPAEVNSQYFLVAIGLCSDIEDKDPRAANCVKYIVEGFKSSKVKEIHKHVNEWIDVLKMVRKSYNSVTK